MKTNVSKSKFVRSVIFIILVSMFIISGVLAGCAASGILDNEEVVTSESETSTDSKGSELLETPYRFDPAYPLWQAYGGEHAFGVNSNQQGSQPRRLNIPLENGRMVVRFRLTPSSNGDMNNVYTTLINEAIARLNRITNSDNADERLRTPIQFIAAASGDEAAAGWPADTGFNIRISDENPDIPGENALTTDDNGNITGSTITLYRRMYELRQNNDQNDPHQINGENRISNQLLRLLGQTLGLVDLTDDDLRARSVMYFSEGWGSTTDLLPSYTAFDIANIRWLYAGTAYSPLASVYTLWRNRDRQNDLLRRDFDAYIRANTTVVYYLEGDAQCPYYRYIIDRAVEEINRVTSHFANRVEFRVVTSTDAPGYNPDFVIHVSSAQADFMDPYGNISYGRNAIPQNLSVPSLPNTLDGHRVLTVTSSNIYLNDNEFRRNGENPDNEPSTDSRFYGYLLSTVIHELLHTLGLRDLYTDFRYYPLVEPYTLMSAVDSIYRVGLIPIYDLANLLWLYDSYTPSLQDFTNGFAWLFEAPSQTQTPASPTPVPPPDSSNLSISQTQANLYNVLGGAIAVTHTGSGATGKAVTEGTVDDRTNTVRLSSDTRTVTYNYKFEGSISDSDAYFWAIGRAIYMLNWVNARYLDKPFTFKTGTGTGNFTICIQNKDEVTLPGINDCKYNNGHITGSQISLYNNVICDDNGNVDEDYLYCVMLNLLGQTMGLKVQNDNKLASNSVMHKGQLQKGQGVVFYTAFDIANLKWLYNGQNVEDTHPSDFQNISIATPVSLTVPIVSPEYQYELWINGWGGAESFGLNAENKLKYLQTNTKETKTTVTYHLFVELYDGFLFDTSVYEEAIKAAMAEINKVTGKLIHPIIFELDSESGKKGDFNIYIREKSGAHYSSYNEYYTNESGGITSSNITLYDDLLGNNADSIRAEALHSLMYTLGLAGIRNSNFWGNSVMYIETPQRLTKLTAFDIANIKWCYDRHISDYSDFIGGDTLLSADTEGLKYELNSDGRSYTVTGIGTAKGEITIPSVYDGLPVTKIGDKAFMSCDAVTSITIPNSIKYIGAMAFADCTALTSIYISKSVTYIGEHAFFCCSALASITVEDKNTVFHSANDCLIETASKTLVLGCKNSIIPTDGSVTSIGYEAFAECTGLTRIDIPDSVTSIGEAAFRGCKLLTDIYIPDSVTSIGIAAFWGCNWYGFKVISIPDSVTYIGTMAFADCSSLIRIRLPKTVTSINIATFWGCTSLKSITIPYGVKSIGESAFYGCTSLEYVGILTSVEKIGGCAFAECSALKEIYYNGTKAQWEKIAKPSDWDKNAGKYTIDYLGDGTEGLKYVLNADGKSYMVENIGTAKNEEIVIASEYEGLPVTAIGNYAFKDCKFITSVTIPDSITFIGEYAFYGCTSLTSITLPNRVRSIGTAAFAGCTSLSSVELPIVVASIGDYAFYNCTSLTSIKIPARAHISVAMFKNCTALTSVVLPKRVRCISTGAFSGCTSLSSITIYKNVKIIGGGAFSHCTSLSEINYIGTEAQWGRIELGENWDKYAGKDTEKGKYTLHCRPDDLNFDSTKGLKYVLNADGKSYTVEIGTATDKDIIIASEYENLPVTGIKSSAFKDCTFIRSIDIPDSVTTIGEYAFYGCTSLSSVDVPYSVTTIEAYAFAECSALTNIYFEGTEVEWNTIDKDDSWDRNTGKYTIHYIGEGTEGLKYVLNSDGKSYSLENIGTATDKDIVIASTYNGLPVTCIESYAFKDCAFITSITIPDSVTIIREYAFYGCTSLASIYIPNSVIAIGSFAFSRCASLTSVVIPNGVTSIEYCAFSGCTSLKSVVIPNGVKSIGGDAFSGCASLTSIAIPNGVTYIGGEAFDGCSSLTSVTIPDSVTSIGIGIFRDCTSLSSVIISNNIKSIENYTFESCTSLTSIVIPDSVTIIGEFAFFDCKSLTSVVIPDSVTVIGEAAFVVCTSLTSVVIPDSVTLIEIDAFAECSALTDIYFEGSKAQWDEIKKEEDWDRATGNYTIHYLGDGTEGLKYVLNEDGKSYMVENIGTATDKEIVIASEYEGLPVTGIGNYAFKDCTFITSIHIPDSVTSIGWYAFAGCTSLSCVTIPNSVTSIGNCAFQDCTSLSSIEIPNSVTSISTSAFYGCTSLSSVVLPNSVTSIGGYIFAHCTSLSSVVLPNSVTSIGTGMFYGCSSLSSIDIPNSVTTIGMQAFYGCTLLSSVVIPNITSLATGVFTQCSSLTHVSLPDGVVTIGEQAFLGCTSLSSIDIPNSVTYIGYYAFADCPAFADIYFEGTKADWDKIGKNIEWVSNTGNYTIHYLGDGTEGLKYVLNADGKSYTVHIGTATGEEIIIPSEHEGLPVTAIGEKAFEGCKTLTSVIIPDSVTIIGDDAFAGCSSLASIVLPNDVTNVGEYAFASCKSLKNITMGSGVTAIAKGTFLGCETLTDITIGSNVESIGVDAFALCDSLTSITIGESITEIRDGAFAGCSLLVDISFKGTKDQWDKVKKGLGWDNAAGNYTVHCTDGDIAKG